MAEKKTTVQRGDRFVKVENPRTVWVVDEEVNHLDIEPHVRLVQEDRLARKRTLAVSVLLDKSFHRKV